MFCSKCGSQLPDDSSFCSKCGHSLAPTASQPAPPPMQAATPLAQQPTADSVRRAIEDKEIQDAGAGCMGSVVLVGSIVVAAGLSSYFNVGCMTSGVVGLVLFLAGMIWVAQKRYPR